MKILFIWKNLYFFYFFSSFVPINSVDTHSYCVLCKYVRKLFILMDGYMYFCIYVYLAYTHNCINAIHNSYIIFSRKDTWLFGRTKWKIHDSRTAEWSDANADFFSFCFFDCFSIFGLVAQRCNCCCCCWLVNTVIALR